jgi:hypothetical protein
VDRRCASALSLPALCAYPQYLLVCDLDSWRAQFISDFLSTTRSAIAMPSANRPDAGPVVQAEMMRMLEAQLRLKTERPHLEALLETLEQVETPEPRHLSARGWYMHR